METHNVPIGTVDSRKGNYSAELQQKTFTGEKIHEFKYSSGECTRIVTEIVYKTDSGEYLQHTINAPNPKYEETTTQYTLKEVGEDEVRRRLDIRQFQRAGFIRYVYYPICCKGTAGQDEICIDIPSLLELIASDDRERVRWAERTIKYTKSKAFEPLLTILECGSDRQKIFAARLLGQIGDASLLPALIPFYERESQRVSKILGHAIGKIIGSVLAEHGPAALEDLSKVLRPE